LFSGDSSGDNEHIVEAERIAYGRRPVYLSVEPWFSPDDYDLLLEYGRPRDFVLLSVDAAGLVLLADAPRLAEQMDVHRDGDALVRDGVTPLDRWFRDGRLPIASLRDKVLAEAAIAVTGTCATLSPVEPGRISVVTHPPLRRRAWVGQMISERKVSSPRRLTWQSPAEPNHWTAGPTHVLSDRPRTTMCGKRLQPTWRARESSGLSECQECRAIESAG